MKRIVFLSFIIFLGLQVQAGETTAKTEAILASTIEVAKKNDYVLGDFVQLNKSTPALLKKLAELKFPMNLLSSWKIHSSGTKPNSEKSLKLRKLKPWACCGRSPRALNCKSPIRLLPRKSKEKSPIS